MDSKNNPVIQRIYLLEKEYNRFLEKKEARVCHWLVPQNDLEMIETFVMKQLSEDSSTKSVFLILETPFTDIHLYSKQLLTDVAENINGWNEGAAKTPDQPQIKWQPGFNSKNKSLAGLWIENMNALTEGFCLEEDCFATYVLLPGGVPPDYSQLAAWLEDALNKKINPEIHLQARFMLLDSEENGFYKKLATTYPELVTTLSPNVDTDAAVAEVAASGDPSDPGVQFRNYFLNTGTALHKKQYFKANENALAALAIAKQQGWGQMEIVIYNMLCSDYLGRKIYEKALEENTKAVNTAKKLIEKDSLLGAKLLAQCLSVKGTILFLEKKYENSFQAYVESSTLFETVGDYLLAMENWRMAGSVAKKKGEKPEAWYCYSNSIKSAGYVNETILQNSTLPIAGKEMMELSTDLGYDPIDVDTVMKGLAGEDWMRKATLYN